MARNAQPIRVEGAVKEALENCRNRLPVCVAAFLLVFAAIMFRLVNLGLSNEETAAAKFPGHRGSGMSVERGAIVDRNGMLLATNLKTYSLYANAKIVQNPQKTAEELRRLFPDLARAGLADLLGSGKSFVWIKRNLHPHEQYQVNNLGIPGLEFQEEEKRTYPHGALLGHALGTVGVDGHGLSGVEKTFDGKLLGVADGSPLTLSIDLRVQDVLHRELLERYQMHKAKGAAGLVMDAHSGEILALVSLPGFDPNLPRRIDPNAAFNRATLGVYEMGSTFKAFTFASALDSGAIALDEAYDATNPIQVARFTISDYHPKSRWLTVPEIFMYSSNIGTARIAEKMGADIQKKYLKRLGLFDPLSIELTEKSKPLFPEHWGRLSTMTIGYGHGMAVTPVHVAAGMAALVNGGTFYPPTLLKLEKNQRREARKVFSPKTSDIMRKLLHLVVESGTGTLAGARGYLVGGKTGTAEKPGEKNYDENRLITSFVGAFPMHDPRYVIVVALDEPQGIKETFGYATAGYTAAPVVKNVVEYIAPILGVAPVDEDAPSIRKTMHVDYIMDETKERQLANVQ